MTNQDPFRRKAELVVKTLPLLSNHPDFALKGGTAINFFERDFPRYSVDIDLTYLPLQDRQTTLAAIDGTIKKLQATLQAAPLNIPSRPLTPSGVGVATSLQIGTPGNQIILETNYIMRGAVNAPKQSRLAPAARDELQSDCMVQTLSFDDTFAGKLCAALSRQHPRDLFDVKILLETEGITPGIARAFIVYLASDSRTFHELLAPNPVDISTRFLNDFVPINRIPITVNELLETRRQLVPALHKALTDKHRAFLLSFMDLAPEWDLLDVPHAKDLPGIRWKLMNLEKMDKDKRKLQTKQLEQVLSGKP